MKTLKILAAIAATACLWACVKDKPVDPDNNNDPVTETPSVSVSPATVAFEGEGGTLRVAVTTNVETFTVSGNPEWLSCQISGKEISLTAAANTVNEARSCTLTVTAETATASIAVSQKAGSPYPGFAVLKSAELEYGGTMLYTFMKPTEEDYGGWATMGLVDEDGNKLVIWMYTDLFTSAEEVELTPGLYVKGEDDYANLKLCAKKLTYMPGVTVEGDEEDEGYTTGTYFVSVATEQEIPLVDGTLEVIKEGDGYVIKVDLTDAQGTAYKYVYTGDVPIDAEGATYPSGNDRIDVAATLIPDMTTCYYNGDAYGAGTANYALILYSGDPASPVMTQIEFNGPYQPYAEDIDLSGTYTSPDEEEGPALYGAFSVTPGAMVELFPGFSWPMGTYIAYSYTDILIGDGYDSLILEKQENGNYKFSGAVMSATGDFAMFLNIENLPIPIYDATAQSGEE